MCDVQVAVCRLRPGARCEALEDRPQTLVAKAFPPFPEFQMHALQGLAATEAAHDRDREAAGLLGRAAALLDETGSGVGDFDPSLAREVEATVRGRLGEREFVTASSDR